MGPLHPLITRLDLMPHIALGWHKIFDFSLSLVVYVARARGCWCCVAKYA